VRITFFIGAAVLISEYIIEVVHYSFREKVDHVQYTVDVVANCEVGCAVHKG
jgi:hypothetical protein